MIKLMTIADFWENLNSIGGLIIISSIFLIMTIIVLGWKLLLNDKEKLWGNWGRKSIILSIVIAIIILLNFIEFYFDLPEFFQFL